jgi:hypothetical protein
MNFQFPTIRDQGHPHYVSQEEYHFDTMPAFALGNFYLLSGDLVYYLSKNYKILQSVGTNEDVSIAVWLWSLQVKLAILLILFVSSFCHWLYYII